MTRSGPWAAVSSCGVPVDYEIRGRIVYSRATGKVSPGDMKAHVNRLLTDEAVPLPLREVWNGLEIEGFSLFGQDIRDMVGTVARQKHSAEGARVALVTKNPVVYGLGRVAQAITSALPVSMHLFDTLEDAEAWVVAEDGDGG